MEIIYKEQVDAWRCWSLTSQGLESYSQGAYWPPYTEMVATCRCTEVPLRYCNCGLYAVEDLEWLKRYASRGDYVIGRVRLYDAWGTSVGKGAMYRGTRARILSLNFIGGDYSWRPIGRWSKEPAPLRPYLRPKVSVAGVVLGTGLVLSKAWRR